MPAPRPNSDPELDRPELYLNRELSLLAFQERVLAQARDASTPLLERVRFLCISSKNLDEFFEIRVAGLLQQRALGLPRRESDGLSAEETLAHIARDAHALVDAQYRLLNDVLLPELETTGVRLVKRTDWTERQQRWIRRYFQSEVLPVLTPVGLDPAHPFPRVLNKSLNFAVAVEGEDAYGRASGTAVVQVPRTLPRLIRLPDLVAERPHDFVLLSSIIHAHIEDVFPGMKVDGCFQFRVTRNSDLWVDEEEVEDLMRALEGELTGRNLGDAVRLEVAENCGDEMAQFLLDRFELDRAQLYRVNGPVNLHRLDALHGLVDRADLKYRPFAPRVPTSLQAKDADVFEVLRRGDVLLHHPFESFAPVIELVRRAAADPGVVAVKMTLYRTGADSPLVDALIDAARAGKEVTAVIELRARFDEAANIGLATRLQEAGAIVAYGVVGYKTHAKMLLVVRREGSRLRRYVHVGTGNYHVATARAYTDVSLLSAAPALTEDVHRLFLQLTGLGRTARLKRMLQAPFTLEDEVIAAIEREAAAAREGKPARIVARMNALSEPRVIRALYQASRAGVPIDLIVRGICCLRPGVPGVSETIRVRTIVGRFLEHARVFLFHAGGAERVLASSADWMTRNLAHRVEVAFEIDDERLKRRAIEECLELYLADNAQAWSLDARGIYTRCEAGAQPRRAAQELLLERLCGVRAQESPAEIETPQPRPRGKNRPLVPRPGRRRSGA
jgi:polyphosphate kinase